jgi:hypothetical protein
MHWLGLDVSEIIDVIEKHLQSERWRYDSGSGDAHFGEVIAAIRKRWQEKHPSSSSGFPKIRRTGCQQEKMDAVNYARAGLCTALTDDLVTVNPSVHRFARFTSSRITLE